MLVQKLKILVIEDNTIHYGALVASLGENNYEFVRATTEDEGWEMAHREKPSLIISDVILQEDMDAGFNLCKRLKLDRDTKHIPILIVTRRSLYSDERKTTEVGAGGYITKPYSLATLRDAVDRLLTGK